MTDLLYFITPAYRRLELSEIVFECRRRAIDWLGTKGLEARCVVIADDENLEIAKQFDFDVVKRDNQWLGRRFNDGHEFAAKHGGTHVVPVGSDSFLDPTFLLGNLPGPDEITCSPHYAVVDRKGIKRQYIRVPKFFGITYCLNVQSMKRKNYRPCRDELKRGCDTSTVFALGKEMRINFHESHALECVAFQSYPQITPFTALAERWNADITYRPFSGLNKVYGADLMAKIRGFYRRANKQ